MFCFCHALCLYPYYKFMNRVREPCVSKPCSIQYEFGSIFTFQSVQKSLHIHKESQCVPMCWKSQPHTDVYEIGLDASCINLRRGIMLAMLQIDILYVTLCGCVI